MSSPFYVEQRASPTDFGEHFDNHGAAWPAKFGERGPDELRLRATCGTTPTSGRIPDY